MMSLSLHRLKSFTLFLGVIIRLLVTSLLINDTLVFVECADIFPVAEGNNRFFPFRLDFSALGNGNRFYEFDSMDIQLELDGPIHTLRRIRGNRNRNEHFMGQDDDGRVVMNLLRFVDRQKEITIGSITDGDAKMVYHMYPDGSNNEETIMYRTHINEIREPMGSDEVDEIEDFVRRRLKEDYEKTTEEQEQLEQQEQRQPQQSMNSIIFPRAERTREFMRRSADEHDISRYHYYYRNLDEDDAILAMMVLWTHQVECAFNHLIYPCVVTEETTANMEALVELAVAETNTALELSGAGARIELVHSYRHPTYVETTEKPFANALIDIATDGDGIMDDVHRYRNEYGADLVSLFLHGEDYCGTGFLGPQKNRMFSVVAWDCAVGVYSFGHEIGRNLGCQHDRGTDDACSNRLFRNYGYRDPEGRFRDIMAYNCKNEQCDENVGDGCIVAQRYSNIGGYNELPIGTPWNNCAQTIRKNAPRAAGYMGEDACAFFCRIFSFTRRILFWWWPFGD